ncbi:MAG: DUF6175 family protein [Salegentibacter sp.]
MKTLNALTTVAIYCCCLVWGSFSQIRAQTKEVNTINPSIMVLPRTTEGEDLRTIMDEQPAVRVGISRIKQYLDDRDYTSLDFETLLKATIRDEAITRENQSDFKDRIFRNIPSDIIIEIDMMEQDSGSGNMVRLILEANVTDNGQSMGSLICESNRFYTEDIGALTDAALKSKTDNNISCIDKFLEDMSNNWADLRENGKHVKIEFSLAEDSEWTMDKEVPSKGDRLKYVIEDWLEETAYKNYVVIPIVTDDKLFVEDYRYPVHDPKTNRNVTARHVERQLDRFFSQLDIPVNIDNSRGSMYVTIL